jgi:hypothetical protein
METIAEEIHLIGLKLAELVKAETEAKLTRERVAAQLDTLIRQGSDKKPTEAAIANSVKLHPEMETAEAVLVAATYAKDVARADYEYVRTKKEIMLASSRNVS